MAIEMSSAGNIQHTWEVFASSTLHHSHFNQRYNMTKTSSVVQQTSLYYACFPQFLPEAIRGGVKSRLHVLSHIYCKRVRCTCLSLILGWFTTGRYDLTQQLVCLAVQLGPARTAELVRLALRRRGTRLLPWTVGRPGSFAKQKGSFARRVMVGSRKKDCKHEMKIQMEKATS